MGAVNRIQIVDAAVCISQSVHTFVNDVNPTILPPAKVVGLFNLDMATGLGEGKFWIQTC